MERKDRNNQSITLSSLFLPELIQVTTMGMQCYIVIFVLQRTPYARKAFHEKIIWFIYDFLAI